MTATPGRKNSQATVDPAEVERFSVLAEDWWDPAGRSRALHRMNPTRLAYIRDRVCRRFGREPLGERPLAGLSVLDVGCGGGLVTEPLARLGATVTGLDATPAAIAVASAHAEAQGLAIDYRQATAAELVEIGRTFDLVLALETVEHVAEAADFLADCAALVAPGGGLVLSTFNRTGKAFLLGVVAAEYLLRWVPRGTHDWRRFLRPSEVAAGLRPHGLTVRDVQGIVYNPLSESWHLSRRDLDVSYLLWAERD
ncbi:MAG: bifunctional 2-polyprenyl-6-hydroxyphenol methylase/3-demethylubiquinol 3-O-methyltransferase UbiG [Tistlia sp.]|uniref:bifunctional 2-polyprenyl-6-hydroxyphenol methylase/3-demethylubiquinol 3-O-methyltransferase UbiG n=1 Tax=Tistlia sp. TaxID=3057121 RepID=UPI0034A25DFD